MKPKLLRRKSHSADSATKNFSSKRNSFASKKTCYLSARLRRFGTVGKLLTPRERSRTARPQTNEGVAQEEIAAQLRARADARAVPWQRQKQLHGGTAAALRSLRGTQSR